jgi:probable rRNA maturation factor
MESIQFFFPYKKINLAHRTQLKKAIAGIFKKYKIQIETINYVFESDKVVRGVNKQYLQHNYNTDIITFELQPKGLPIISDIYISIDTVQTNAQDLGVSFKQELHRVIFHGALHLCGLADKTAAAAAEMRKAEDFWLKKYLV